MTSVGPKLRALLPSVGWALLGVILVELAFGHSVTHHIAGVPIPVGINFGDLLLGAILGMLYSLLAFGLILVYRANRFINFAHAGLGLVPAVLALLLIVNLHWPYVPALLVMLIGSAISGALVELAMRRFATSPRLIATVVTIGIAQVFVYLEIELPGWIGGSSGLPYQFPTPYSGLKVTVDGVVFTGDYLAIIVATSVICGGLALFLRKSRSGMAIRAAAENVDRAQLLGVPVARLSTLVWVIAGVCSGVAVFLQAPVTSLPTGGSVSPLVLLYGLAAAVIARMESLPVAFGAGIGLGVIQQASFIGSSKPDDAAAIMLPIVLVALMLQRKRLSRAYDSGMASFKTLQEFRPIPVSMRSLPEVARTRAGLLVTVAALAILMPQILGAAHIGYMSLTLITAMVAISLVVLSGWAGQISLGQYAFAGVGAGVAGDLATRYDMDFFLTIIIAAAVGAAVAILIGIPALRIPGPFLAVVTLAFAASVQYGILSPDHFSWFLPPVQDYIGRPDLYGRINTSSDSAFYYVILVFFVLAYLSAKSLRSSRSGRVFIGLRDNVRAAQSVGINATFSKLSAFALAGAIASVAGALSAYQSQVDANSFSMDLSITVFLYAVVGGLTSLPGAVAGTIVFETIGFVSTPAVQVLATGIGVAICLFAYPGGLAQAGFQARDGALRWVAERRGLHVPGLLADSRIPDQPIPEDTAELDDALVHAAEGSA